MVEGYSAGRAGLLLLPTGRGAGGSPPSSGGWLSDKLSAALLLGAGVIASLLLAALAVRRIRRARHAAIADRFTDTMTHRRTSSGKHHSGQSRDGAQDDL